LGAPQSSDGRKTHKEAADDEHDPDEKVFLDFKYFVGKNEGNQEKYPKESGNFCSEMREKVIPHCFILILKSKGS
jgi:hypothetical protein